MTASRSSPAPAPPYLELDHFVCGQTQVHAVTALELEGALVELGDGLIHVQHGVLLHHLADDLRAAEPAMARPLGAVGPPAPSVPGTRGDGAYQGRQGDAGGRADQLDHGAVADVPFPQGELAPGAALVGCSGREAESPPGSRKTLPGTALTLLPLLPYCFPLEAPPFPGSPARESRMGMQYLAGTLLEAVWAGILLGSDLFQASHLLGFVNLQTSTAFADLVTAPVPSKPLGNVQRHQKSQAGVRLSQIPAPPG